MDADEQHDSNTPAASELRKPGFAAGNPYRFPPGKSGNPSGPPKGASFAAALSRQALTPVTDSAGCVSISDLTTLLANLGM